MTGHPVSRMAATGAAVGVLVAAAALAGCGSSGHGSSGHGTASASRADDAFVLHMLPHHRRAIAVGRLAAQRGSDAAVRAFGQRIVREQTPEATRLHGWVATLHLTPRRADAMAADGYITDGVVRRLRAERGRTFDRDVLLASADSETGAAAMAHRELAGGRYAPARRLATSIATAPHGEIPQLRALAARRGARR